MELMLLPLVPLLGGGDTLALLFYTFSLLGGFVLGGCFGVSEVLCEEPLPGYLKFAVVATMPEDSLSIYH